MNVASHKSWRITIALSSLLSCFVLYPLVHECGHLIPAVFAGATVNKFVWTPFLGHPHVGLSNVSGVALPWVNAGGVLLPTLVGTALITLWMLMSKRKRRPVWHLWIFVPAIVMLLGNLGLPIEATLGSEHFRHMHSLATTVGGDGIVGKLIEVAPTVWSFLTLALACGMWMKNWTSSSDRIL